MKISGRAALDEANFLKRDSAPDSCGAGADVLLEVERCAEPLLEEVRCEELRWPVVRADLPEELLFVLLDEVPAERDLPVFAIIRFSALQD